ncbi:MAG: hypothetical protein H6671_16720 [Anaerolineaceae bacterium]|nr:hypothetical protein [Anaerolineaceae bacterium]
MTKKDSNQEIHIDSMSGGIIANKVENIIQNNKTSNVSDQIDFDLLMTELAQLRKAMRERDSEAEHVIEMAEVQKAEQAAQKKDVAKVKQHLSAAGKWALDIATEIGTSLAKEMLRTALGMN